MRAVVEVGEDIQLCTGRDDVESVADSGVIDHGHHVHGYLGCASLTLLLCCCCLWWCGRHA
jgi:hypothetical protein